MTTLSSSSSKEFNLHDVPTDGISSLAWLGPTVLVAGFWDTSVRLYDVTMNQTEGTRSVYRHKAPVLDVIAGPSSSSVISGGLDMDVRLHDFASNTDLILGNHSNAVKSLLYNSSYRCCISGSWDKSIRLWDIQQSSSTTPSSSSSSAAAVTASSSTYTTKSIAKVDVPDKVYSMTKLDNHSFMVATANRQILTYDLRKLGGNGTNDCLVTSRESSLKHQTRAICASPTGTFIAISSTEGRVGIDYLDSNEQSNSYAFKCHRKKESDNNEIAFPVHALAFHPTYGTFATGGGDGNVFFWDAKARKRIAAIGPYNNSITALNFSPQGNYLAIAVSYDFTGGDKDHAPDSIVIRNITDAEVKPKAVAANK